MTQTICSLSVGAVIADCAIDCPDQARTTGKPWYLCVAFNAPHAPLQALKDDYVKYVGRYDERWDYKLRNKSRVISAIRARKNTKLTIVGGELQMTFNGDDPGLAFDRLSETLASGPYSLSFELRSDATGGGSVHFVTDQQVTLPNGTEVKFEPLHDNQWHSHVILLDTDKVLQQLHLDVCSGVGEARVKDLRLTDIDGNVLQRWPEK